MKALILCSVHALCDIAELERQAFNRACALQGIPVFLSSKDHAHVLATTTMLDLLGHLPGPTEQRETLVERYLDILNDAIWKASISAYHSVFAELLGPKLHARPTGLVSEYPLLTSNLVRSAALLTNATKLGTLSTPYDPLRVPSVAERLATCATSLNVSHDNVEVLVVHERDFGAARSIGMHPRYVQERQLAGVSTVTGSKPRKRMPDAIIVDRPRTQEAFAISA